MMVRTLAFGLALAIAVPVSANSLREANATARVAGSALSVTPTRDWNKLSANVGRRTETWTLDGDALNNVTFFGGIENDRPIFREVDRRNRPLPRFSSTMLLADLPTLIENSYRIARGTTTFTVEHVEPAQFAGNAGLHFRYSFVGADEVRRRGEAYGAMVNGRLFLVTFDAPAIHYFDASVAAFRQLIPTATMAAGRR